MKNFLFILTITILRYKTYILFNLTKFVYYPINILVLNPIYDYFHLHVLKFILYELVKVLTFTNFCISILICIFIIAFFKDFYIKHFRFSGGMFQRLSILWIHRKKITIFIITMVIITFPIRIFIRGFILCLLCKHNILVMILAMPFTCFFSNIFKKYFFNIPFKKEDYYLFNDYVIKNVNLYSIFSILIIQYLYQAYFYYYLCGIILGIVIILFILTENNERFSSSSLFLEANTNLTFSFICCLAVALQEASDTGFKLGVGEKKLTIENTSFPSKRYVSESLLLTPEGSNRMAPTIINAKEYIIQGIETFPILNMTNQQIENIKTKFEREILNTNDITYKNLDLTIQPHSLYYKKEKNLVGLFSYIKSHEILIANIYNTTKYNGFSVFNIHEATEYYNSNKLLEELGSMLNKDSLSFIDFKHIIVLTDYEYTNQTNLIKVPRYIIYNHKDPIQITTKNEHYAFAENIENYSNNSEKRNEAMVIAQNKIKYEWDISHIAKNIYAMYVHSILSVFVNNFERPGLDPDKYYDYLSCKHKDKPFLIHKPSIAINRGVYDKYMDNEVMNNTRRSLFPRAKRIIRENMNKGLWKDLYALNIDEGRVEFIYLEKNDQSEKYSNYSIIDITNTGIVGISTMEKTIILKQTYNIFKPADQETLKKFLTLANR